MVYKNFCHLLKNVCSFYFDFLCVFITIIKIFIQKKKINCQTRLIAYKQLNEEPSRDQHEAKWNIPTVCQLGSLQW